MAISCFPGYSGLHGPISSLVQPSWLAWTEDRWGLEGDNGSLGKIGRLFLNDAAQRANPFRQPLVY